LGIGFSDLRLLEQAFVHRSYLNEHPEWDRDHNERLEFLGDSVLEIIVTNHLYRNYPNPEGELTDFRSALVSGVHLSEVGARLGFHEVIKVSRGERKTATTRGWGFLIANAVEAFFGALYLDQGIEACTKVAEKHILSELPRIIEQKRHRDPKSFLQEHTQEVYGITPTYKVLKEEGADHDKTFTVGVYLDNNLIGSGIGKNKKLAQTAAAENALKNKFKM
jgi:ribonuclease-3